MSELGVLRSVKRSVVIALTLAACRAPSIELPAEAVEQPTRAPQTTLSAATSGGVDSTPGKPRWAPSCSDGIKNGNECDTDCGGSCAPCAERSACTNDADCASKLCIDRVCAPPKCNNGMKDGAESDVDCGGYCPSCEAGKKCEAGSDCASGVCRGHVCAAPTCVDGVRNGEEVDVDCGGPCGACAVASACSLDRDCGSGLCVRGQCVEQGCTDRRLGGSETDVDCGGPSCTSCATGKRCAVGSDCASRVCEGGICQARAEGGACQSSDECGAGTPCVDGVCCGEIGDSTPVGAWATKAPMTLVRYYPAGVHLDGYIYVLGGKRYIEHAGSPDVAMNERYDPATDTWTTRAPMPQPRVGIAVAAWSGRVHVFSGSDHWEYDPVADAWTIRSQLPISLGLAGSAAILGQRIYLGARTALLEYDPRADTYTPRAAAPLIDQYGEMLTAANGKLYAMEMSGFAEYDPTQNAWTPKPAAPTTRSVLSSGWNIKVGGRIYVVAGGSTATESYDPLTSSWATHAPMPGPARDAAATTALCGRIYVVGGGTPGYSYTTNTVFHAPR